jgi:hypothetical protein
MVAIRLAYFNTKRLLRHKGLRIAFAAVPLAIAALRAAFAGSATLLLAARLCPLVCALLIGAVLYTQWSVDAAAGLLSGLRACPIAPRTLILSRIAGGASILAVQMALFVSILAIRF